MMTIDKLESKLDKINESIHSLSFFFSDREVEKEAEDTKNSAIEALETYLELATNDDEQRRDEQDEIEDLGV